MMRPRICVPIMEKNVKKAARTVRLLDRHDPDLIELRFDLMKSASSFSMIRDATERPLIATNRSRAQGGQFSGTQQNRLGTLMSAAREGFDYVDIELTSKDDRRVIHNVREDGAEIIISHHNSKLTPTESTMKSILEKERRAGADICKIVCTARGYRDSLRCLKFVEKHATEAKLVCFCMGKHGISSRVLSPLFGGYFTFASFRPGLETAPGQIPIDELRSLYKELGVA